MFEDWKQAWREAVANFQRELEDEPGDATTRAMRRDERTAAESLRRLDAELAAARRNAEAERNEEAVCRRREGLAVKVGDTETARIAAEYAERHAERAVVLERKIEVLEAERLLLLGDLERMRAALRERGVEPRVESGTGGPPLEPPSGPDLREREREGQRVRRMEREARERAAEERREQLKPQRRQAVLRRRAARSGADASPSSFCTTSGRRSRAARARSSRRAAISRIARSGSRGFPGGVPSPTVNVPGIGSAITTASVIEAESPGARTNGPLLISSRTSPGDSGVWPIPGSVCTGAYGLRPLIMPSPRNSFERPPPQSGVSPLTLRQPFSTCAVPGSVSST